MKEDERGDSKAELLCVRRGKSERGCMSRCWPKFIGKLIPWTRWWITHTGKSYLRRAGWQLSKSDQKMNDCCDRVLQ